MRRPARTGTRRPLRLAAAASALSLGAGLLLMGFLARSLSLHFLWSYLAGINLATLLAYGFDKWSARRSADRVPEMTLHIFALAGGSPGALLAQRLFRHKTRKGRFLLIYWAILIAQLGLLGYWLWTHR